METRPKAYQVFNSMSIKAAIITSPSAIQDTKQEPAQIRPRAQLNFVPSVMPRLILSGSGSRRQGDLEIVTERPHYLLGLFTRRAKNRVSSKV